MVKLLRLMQGWLTCPRCEAKDSMIAFLEKNLAESKRRESSAIDQLLAFQGKPPVRETILKQSQLEKMLNPFAEAGPGNPIEPSIFDDVMESKK